MVKNIHPPSHVLLFCPIRAPFSHPANIFIQQKNEPGFPNSFLSCWLSSCPSWVSIFPFGVVQPARRGGDLTLRLVNNYVHCAFVNQGG